MKPSTKRLFRLLLLGLVVACLFVLASPHDALHDQPGADCALCFAPATEAPEPVQVARPVLRVTHLEETHAEIAPKDWDWKASAPRAPPAGV